MSRSEYFRILELKKRVLESIAKRSPGSPGTTFFGKVVNLFKYRVGDENFLVRFFTKP